MSETVCCRRRGRIVVRWKDRVKEYMHKRVADRGGGIELARIESVWIRRGRGSWKDRVKEYIHERIADKWEGIEVARRECVDRERWRLFCRGYSLTGRFWRERGVTDS